MAVTQCVKHLCARIEQVVGSTAGECARLVYIFNTLPVYPFLFKIAVMLVKSFPQHVEIAFYRVVIIIQCGTR